MKYIKTLLLSIFIINVLGYLSIVSYKIFIDNQSDLFGLGYVFYMYNLALVWPVIIISLILIFFLNLNKFESPLKPIFINFIKWNLYLFVIIIVVWLIFSVLPNNFSF